MKNKEERSLVLQSAVDKGALSPQDLIEYKTGQKIFQSEELFIRKKLSGTAGVIEFINENDVQKNCVTNISKGYVPSESNIIVDKIGMRFGYSSVDVAPELVSYSNAIFSIDDLNFDAGAVATGDSVVARRIPIQIENAEYELKVDSILMDSGRVAELLSHNVSIDGVSGYEKNLKELEWPKLFLSGKKITLNLKFPENGTVPAGFYYAELVCKGLGLGKRQGK